MVIVTSVRTETPLVMYIAPPIYRRIVSCYRLVRSLVRNQLAAPSCQKLHSVCTKYWTKKQDNLIDGGFDSILSSFRLGRLRAGGAKGPGLFFILPCIDRWATINVDYTECLFFTGPPLKSLSMENIGLNSLHSLYSLYSLYILHSLHSL